ncbi:hypothetical protein KMW28_08540 [Flammeovirga yaeyamensis]|uniref:Uncharacterized protein n=1 Tax=Flammeovirga yaeyamensis TaxID=367791 RepID=A0AAX1N7W0_9BACT|nr:hypothetical protein [Flammeovirga yaeyamensis]MBB3698991.1 hypothetical protein [Flammeovirga yaeyamensis]NMF36425.1 hypothetical protein [Flammeovirga yaeyamensis]QWG03615.1 hypothetical protein KMW28_08540 [Flammeovirga yaeyamensis]
MRNLLLSVCLLIGIASYAQEIHQMSHDEAMEEFQKMIAQSEVNTGGLQELRYYIETSDVNLNDYIYIGKLLQIAPQYTQSLLETARQISFSPRESNLYHDLIELPLLDLARAHTSEISALMKEALRSRNHESDEVIQKKIDALVGQCHYKEIENFIAEQATASKD